uniref:protein-tyrosine-phosphatase n=1 Tax=Echinococcus granulosus TaxID=6210 RepID=A0A068WLK4_ECHGR|nr:receptor type tyrosine protein phosphatase [Echinococcus granulosus]
MTRQLVVIFPPLVRSRRFLYLCLLCLLFSLIVSRCSGQAFLLQDLEELSDLLLSKEKPRIVQPLKSEKVISGQPVLFVCMVEGNPSPQVQWTISGISVFSSPQFGEVIAMPRGSVLRIANALPTLNGSAVVCIAENALGHAEATARLFVYQNEEVAPSGFPRFLNVFSVIVAKKNDKVELECRTQGEPSPLVRWFKDSTPIDLTNTRFLVTPAGSLEIARLMEDDEGKYECTATNSHGTRISPGENLMVREDIEEALQIIALKTDRFRPHFTSVPAAQQVVPPGGQIALTCTAVGVPVPTVAWFEHGTQLFRNMLDRQPPGTARLSLTNLKESRNVSCVAASAMGQATHYVTIVVKELPPTPGEPQVLHQLKPGEVTLVFDRPLSFTTVTATNTITTAPDIAAFVVQWIESRYFLRDYLNSLSPDIAAAIHPIGGNSVLFSPHLSAAVATAATEASNQVGLQFRLIPIAETEQGELKVKSKLTGLKPYTNYTVWCRSVGVNGDVSPSTKPVHFTTDQEAPSSPPLRIRSSAISIAAVSVSWDQPLQTNGPITMYRVYYTENPKLPLADWSVKLVQVDSALSQSDLTGSTSTLTLLTHLRTNATYHIRVSASNIKGDGPISPPYPVIVRPGALPPPVNFKAVSKSAHEVSLHWDTPDTQQREPPLVNYELLVTPLDGEGNMEATSRQIFIEPSLYNYLVNGLLPNTKYEFRLAAVSETGAGIQAETTAKTKEYVPGPPNRVTVEATGSDRLRVTWTPPKESILPSLLVNMGQRANELRIAFYDIDIRTTDAKGNWLSGPQYGTVDQQRPLRQQSTSERKIEEARGKLAYTREIAGLRPSTYYVVHIRAVSRSGSGDRAKSNPTMTWPLPPHRPTSLKLRTAVSPNSRRRILRVQWGPPLQEKVPMGGFKYRVQWRLLIQPKGTAGYDNANLEPVSPERAKELGIMEELIGGEENVTELNWDSPAGRLIGGLSYELRVATMDEYQTGESVIGRIELPDDVPTLPPSGVRIDTTSPHLPLHWKAPPLEARNGHLVAYEVECSWVDASQSFTDSWQTRSIKIIPEDSSPPSTLFWPPGRVSLLNISTLAAASFRTVYRGRVRAWTPADAGPWSEFVSLNLKNLVPKEPTSVNAVYIEKKGVLVTWAMPEGFIQTSHQREKARSKTSAKSIIYRQFVVEYAKQVNIAQPTLWMASKTAGPQTSITLPILENPENYVVRVQSVGIANLHSEWSAPILVQKVHSTDSMAVENLKCQAVTENGSNAELELTWNLVELPTAQRIIHYLVNYTGGRVYLNADGHRIRESQGEREQSLRAPEVSFGMVVHRLVGLSFNSAYQVDVLPVFKRSMISGVFGEAESVFCRTLSKPPQFVPTPDFHPSPNGGAGLITVYRADEQNGTVATYEILAREAGPIGKTQALAVLAQFPAVTLFRPLTKVVRVVLNGSAGANAGGEGGTFFAPPLMPGQTYQVAVRACVEGHDAIASEVNLIRGGDLSAASLCSTSDWSGLEPRNSDLSKTNQSAPQVRYDLEEDDPLWPAIVRENISAIATAVQTPFNDAATVPRLGEQDLISTEIYFPSANGIVHVAHPVPRTAAVPIAGSSHSDRIQIIVAALSIIVGVCILAFVCFLIIRHFQHHGGHSHHQHDHHGGKFGGNGNTIKPLEAAQMKLNHGGISNFSSPTAPLLRYEPLVSGQGMRSPDGLSLHSELLGTASLGRFGGNESAAMMSMGSNCVCSTPTATGTAVSLEMLSMGLGGRQPPPPYFMNPPPPLIPDMLNDQVTSQPVALEDLASHVEQLKQNQGLLLSAEFESIDPGGQFTWEHSSRPANRPKNRYANVVTYDHSRVILSRVDGDLESDYINANFLDGYNRKRAYIATQGPLPNTVCDFWRMVWEQRSSTIVAMTRLEERERIKCEQYWPGSGLPASSRLSPTKSLDWLSPRTTIITNSESAQTIATASASPIATTTYGQITVSLMEVMELAYYTVRTFTVQKSGCREKREIRHLQFTAWPDHGVPNHPAPLLMFLRRVNAEFVPDAGPIIVHCSAGVGRTGAYIVLDILLQQMHHENAVNVLAVVTQLRSQRNFVVQTKEQYVFIYEALLEAALSGNTELPARQLRGHWHKLIVPCCSEEESITTPPLEPNHDPLANTGLALEFGQLVNQTAGPFAALIAHQSPGGLLACSDSFTDSPGNVLSGALPVNIPKNRCGTDFVPYESNRVKLSSIRGVEGSDYINASYVDSYRSRSAFIATQTPMMPFVEDFWRMIWESGSCIIVQLDSYEFDKEPPYWPVEEATRFGFLVAEALASYDMTAYVLREFRLTDAKSSQSRIIRLFEASHLSLLIGRAITSPRHMNQSGASDVTLPPSLPPLAEWLPNRSLANNTPTFGFINGGTNYYRSVSTDSYGKGVFDDLTCQKAAVSLIDLIEQVHKTQEQFGLEGPITVHCRTGTGYTGMFLMLSILFDRMRVEGVVDAFQTTKLLWWQRRGLVETPTEYAFCYTTALEYLNLYEPLPVNQTTTQTPSSTLS